MRIIIYGAGGIGGVIGAQLFQGGHDVTLIARGAHLERIQRDGLRYETPHGAEVLAIDAVGHPSDVEFRDDDVVLLTMKAQHTLDALDTLCAAAGDRIPVICGQNGVENERMALRRFRHVYGMCVYLPSNFLEPGIIQTHAATSMGVLDTGCYPEGIDGRLEEFMAMLESVNFSARPVADIMPWKYSKLLTNLTNALNAVCPETGERTQIREILRDEGAACLRAAGIDFISEDEVKARRGNLLKLAKIDGVGRVGDSSWQGLMRGNRDIEADYLNGEIVLLGRSHGVATPANEIVLHAANAMAREGTPPQSLSSAELLQQLKLAGS